MTYEELAALAQTGDEDAGECLIRQFRDIVRGKARKYFIAGADSEDVVQEAMIGLFKAIQSYDPARGAGFKTYAEICINRQIISAIKAAGRKKHGPLNSSLSLSRPADEDPTRTLEESIAAKGESDPEKLMIMKEIVDCIMKNSTETFSPFETKIMTEYMLGSTYGEIADKLGKTPKAVYNAMGRVKKKIGIFLDGK